MTLKTLTLVEKAYYEIGRTSFQAATVQAGANLGSLLFGGLPVTHLIVDGFAIGFQFTLTNTIREIFAQPALPKDAAVAFLKPNLEFFASNLLLDKGIGMAVPLLGLPFCFALERNLTWRVGTYATAVCTVGSEQSDAKTLERIAEQVADAYPRSDFLFKLADPAKDKFIRLITAIEAEFGTQADVKFTVVSPQAKLTNFITQAGSNQGNDENEVTNVESDLSHDEMPELSEESDVVDTDFTTVVEISDSQLPLPLGDETFDTPVAVIPKSLISYWNSDDVQPRVIREGSNEMDETESVGETDDKSADSPKADTQSNKRKHIATGKKPSGRPKKG